MLTDAWQGMFCEALATDRVQTSVVTEAVSSLNSAFCSICKQQGMHLQRYMHGQLPASQQVPAQKTALPEAILDRLTVCAARREEFTAT